jgi:hypothetical protein
MKNGLFAHFKTAAIASSLGIFVLSQASTTAAVTGSAAANGLGGYLYEFTVDNTAGSFDISAWTLEFPFAAPDWNQTDTFGGGDVTVPNQDWLAGPGTAVVGLSAQDFLSFDAASDVTTGSTLGTFAFTSAYPPGTVNYYAFSPAGASISGTVVGPVVPASVPDGGAGSAALLALALGACIAARKQKA